GRIGPFLVAVVLAFTFAYMLIVLARDAAVAHERASVHLVVWSAVWGSGFMAAAYAIAAMMPLDVVLDGAGITFAGASRTWATIRGVTRTNASHLALHASSGDLQLGPGPGKTI